MEKTSTSTSHATANVDQKCDQPAADGTDEPPIPHFQPAQSREITRTSSSRTDISDVDVATSAHTLSIPRLLDVLSTSATEGLTKDAAAARLTEYGENSIGGDEGISLLRLLVSQLGKIVRVIVKLFGTELYHSQRAYARAVGGAGTQFRCPGLGRRWCYRWCNYCQYCVRFHLVE